MAVIANVALTNTFDTWRTRTNIALTRLNAFAINESALYANTLTANVTFTSKGLATFQGRATVGTNLSVTGNTTTGKATVTNLLTVSGNTTLGGASKTLTFGGAGATANMTGWFGVTGRQSISTNLFVGGNTKFAKSVGINVTPSSWVGALEVGTSGGSIWSNNAEYTYWGTNNYFGGANWQYKSAGTATQYVHSLGNHIFYTASSGLADGTITWIEKFRIAASGLITAPNSLTVTNRITSGNTTLGGTTTDNSNALSQTLTDGATINWDVSLGRVATVTLGAAGRTMAAPTNLKVGTYILRVYQDATGSRTITTWNSVFKWTAAVAPVLSTGANKLDIITFFSDGTNLYGSYLPDMR